MGYVQDLARHFQRGDLSVDVITALDDEDAITRLTAVRGIGRWTAEIYLLFAEGREDVWPATTWRYKSPFNASKASNNAPRVARFTP